MLKILVFQTTFMFLAISLVVDESLLTTAFIAKLPNMIVSHHEQHPQSSSFVVDALNAADIPLNTHANDDDDDDDDKNQQNNRRIHEAEEAAAWDGHDSIDAGMETAAEERALMMAEDLATQLKKKTTSSTNADQQELSPIKPTTTRTTTHQTTSYDDQHVAHGIHQVHIETNQELQDAEELAAWDGHDSADDAGMETAAEERALMMAAELARTMKTSSSNTKKKKNNNNSNNQELHNKKRSDTTKA